MKKIRNIVNSFLAALSAELEPYQELGTELADVLDRATCKWPRLSVAPAAFVAYLAERLPPGNIQTALQRIHVTDLYLAYACSLGDSAAIASFHETYFSDVEKALRSMEASHLADEVRQEVYQKLFVARDGVPPRITDYGGQGELRTWFRVVALRFALSMMRRVRREVPMEDELLLGLQATHGDPELQFLRKHRLDVKQAFRRALKTLSSRQRTILRMHLIDGLTIHQLGRLYKVHPSTAFRWIAAAKQTITKAIRKDLTNRLGLSGSGLESLLEQISSQLDLGIESALRA